MGLRFVHALRLLARPQPGRYVSNVHRSHSSWASIVQDPKNKLQAYISESQDPFLNLSAEQYLLQHSPADSIILLLYINRPCVVIGRNQNPWTEVNLNILHGNAYQKVAGASAAALHVDLVRRRSGGGAVFHDEGNVNWAVICPSADFTRDKHAELIVRALRRNGIARARVNERHDIVLDQGSKEANSTHPDDLHRTPFTMNAIAQNLLPFKVSGSAYRLTRGRALHHGTCLLSSPNLSMISQYLRSPAKTYIKSKGVDSVSSPVANIGLDVKTFIQSVRTEFKHAYCRSNQLDVDEKISEAWLEVGELKDLWEEMQKPDWIFGQTPYFELSNSYGGAQSSLVSSFSVQISLESRHGQIEQWKVSGVPNTGEALANFNEAKSVMVGKKLYSKSWTWEQALDHIAIDEPARSRAVAWLELMLPR